MTSIINSSNSNSALIQTVEASDSRVNPSIYNVKEVNPTYANTWVSNQPVNGSAEANRVQNYNLQKYGIIQQMLLTYTKEYTATQGSAASSVTVPAGDVFNVISKVELLSSSRVVEILTTEDMAAQFSNLTAGEYGVIEETCLGARVMATTAPAGGGQAGDDKVTSTYVVPLHFGFMNDPNLNLNSSFLETLSLRVTWGSDLRNFTVPAGGGTQATFPATSTFAMSNVELKILYKSMGEAPTAELLAANYSADSLVQVSTRFYDENRVDQAGSATPDPTKVELKNTDCVEAFYVMAREIVSTAASATAQTTGYGAPIAITSLTFTGSGQEILTLKEHEIPYTRLQKNGWSTSTGTKEVGSAGLENIAKIQNGLYKSDCLSNTMSLREINAGQISVTFAQEAGKNYQVTVSEECTAIFQTASNTGRLSLALSN